MSTPQAVKHYLAEKSINPLIKWITTQLVIHQPNDPLHFIHNLTKLTISQNEYKYSPELIAAKIEQIRFKTDVEIENEAKVLKEQVVFNNESSSEPNLGLNQDFSRIIDSMQVIASELDPTKVAHIITRQATKLLQCEKALFCSYDAEKEILQMNSDDSANKDFKFPVNSGILSRCIKSRKYEIIDNINEDKECDESIYNTLNIKAASLLCCPLKDFDTDEVSSIILAINKENNAQFTAHDVDLLNALGTIGQIALQNGIIYELAFAEKKRNESMLALWRHLNDESKVFNINSLLFTITRRCLEIVDAEKCTFYFVDQQNKELWSMQGDVNIRMPIDKGIAGLCATSGEIVNVSDVYNHPQFDKEHDEKTGFSTKSTLVVPMKGKDNKIIGMIQLINKRGIIEVFDRNDEQILELVLSAASAIVEQNQLFFIKKENGGKVSPTHEERYVSDLERPSPERRASSISVLVEEDEASSD